MLVNNIANDQVGERWRLRRELVGLYRVVDEILTHNTHTLLDF